jgi:uncharacterized membrane protein YvlD (DUF360 family)
LIGRIALRVALTTLALMYAFPHISGIGFHGDWMAALMAASVFNLVFFGLECLLTVIVLGINISTLGLGALITGGIKFVAAILAPSLALAGTAKVLPNMFQVTNWYQGLLVAGLVLGGLLFAAVPEKKKQAT